MARKRLLGLAIVALVSLAGCRKGGVALTPLATSVERPSNVAFLIDLSVDGEPAPGLEESSFSVREDDRELSSDSVGLTLLDPSIAVDTGTLLLVDVTNKDEARGEALARAVGGFVDEVRQVGPVWLYVFDGNAEIFELSTFEVRPPEPEAEGEGEGAEDAAVGEKDAAEPEPLSPELELLAKAATPEPSRNLNGALDAAVAILDEKLSGSDKPFTSGNVVVLVSGPDTAGRAPADGFRGALERSRHRIYAVGPEAAPVRDITRDHAFVVPEGTPAESALGDVASRLVDAARSRYLMSYCSPARRGRRAVEVEVTLPGGKRRGGFEAEFYADGFSDDCDASTPPGFLVTLLQGPDGPVPMAPVSASASRPKKTASVRRKPAGRRARPRPRRAPPKPAPEAPPAPEEKPAAAPTTSDGFEP